MEQKELNLSQKFKLSITLGAIILFVVMFISLAVNGNKTSQEYKIKDLCEEIFIQEVNNIKIGHQNIDGAMWLLGNSECKYTQQEVIDAVESDEPLLCSSDLWREYGWFCTEHINEWYPGKLTASGDSQEMPELEEKTSHDRFKELSYKYGLDPSEIWEVENKYGIREGLILAILIAETSGGKNGAYVSEGCYNLGNVGNNDRGDRRCYTSKKESIEAIGRALSNQYLGTTQTLGCLSKAGSCTRWEDKGHVYASSGGNWERTITNVLNAIYQEELGDIDPERFNVRRTFTTYQ